LIVIGLLTGTITAISAGSGVTVAVPLLTLLFGYSIHTAIGTSLLVDLIASLNVAFQYHYHGRMDLKSGAWLALGAIVGAQIGSHFAIILPQEGLQGGFGVFVIFSGLTFFYRAFGKKKLALDWIRFKNNLQQILVILLIGLYIGISMGLFGSGGGATILLVLVYILNYQLHTAIGTATALMAISAVSGVTGYALHGSVEWLDGAIIGIAAMVSGSFFCKIANRASEKALNVAVGFIFVCIGIAMFFIEGGSRGILHSIQIALK